MDIINLINMLVAFVNNGETCEEEQVYGPLSIEAFDVFEELYDALHTNKRCKLILDAYANAVHCGHTTSALGALKALRDGIY